MNKLKLKFDDEQNKSGFPFIQNQCLNHFCWPAYNRLVVSVTYVNKVGYYVNKPVKYWSNSTH